MFTALVEKITNLKQILNQYIHGNAYEVETIISFVIDEKISVYDTSTNEIIQNEENDTNAEEKT